VLEFLVVISFSLFICFSILKYFSTNILTKKNILKGQKNRISATGYKLMYRRDSLDSNDQ